MRLTTIPVFAVGIVVENNLLGGSVGSELSGKYIEQKSSQEDRKK